MGWKPGEGVGAKMSRKHRQKLKWSLTQEKPKELPSSPPHSEQPTGVKVYGVAMPPTTTKISRLDDDEDDYLDEQIVRVFFSTLLSLIFIYFSSMLMLVYLH